MHIVLPFESPVLQQQIAAIAADNDIAIKLSVVDLFGELPDAIDADAMLMLGVGEAAQLHRVLERAHNVKWIHVFGTGVDSFPLDSMGKRLLTCSRGAHALPIAEWVMAMLLGAEKQLPNSWVSEPPENWHSAELGLVSGKTLGLFGYGCIGSLVAQRALAFGMNVKAVVRTPRESWPKGIEPLGSVEELLSVSDHLVLAAPATPATYHLIDEDSLKHCKPGMHIINVARGSLIDQEALKLALESGAIGRASLDVVEPEPLAEGHWLYTQPNVYISPHISWSAPEMVEMLAVPFINNIIHFAKGEAMEGVVDLTAGY